MRGIIATVFIVLFCCHAAAAAAASKAICMKTEHSVFGPATIFISALGLKILNPQRHNTLVCCPPEWKVTVYDDAQKVYATSALKQYLKNPNLMVFRSFNQVKVAPAATGKKDTLFAVPIYEYASSHCSLDDRTHEASYWIVKDPSLPLDACRVYSQLSNLPILPGVVVKTSSNRRDGFNEIALKTYGIKFVNLSQSDYSVPKNFKLSKSMDQVLFSEDLLKAVTGL